MEIVRTNPLEATFAQLSFLIEANDYVAGALIRLLGAQELLALIRRADSYPKDVERKVAAELGEVSMASQRIGFHTALKRWRNRLPYAPPAQFLLDEIRRVGGGILLPSDPLWPRQVNDLDLGAPLCLWWRSSDRQRLGLQQHGRNVGIVGSRDSSDYGNQATTELAGGLVRQQMCVISGGAYGIDAAAHRAALGVEDIPGQSVPTIAILAGGLDRLYPAGNNQLLTRVIERGVLLSEAPPGTAPARFRFLNRNRLIAAFCHLVVVAEARYRSGALNTARQAVDLGREVAAVPGSVFSPNSVGTHRLLRAGEAALITNVQDALELLPATPVGTAQPVAAPVHRAGDELNAGQRLVLDVLSRQRALSLDELCARSGVPVPETLNALQLLKRRGQATDAGGLWKRVGE